MNSIIAELKRRNVFRVGIAYLVIGWVIIQIAETVGPIMLLPDWFVRVVVMLLMLGFPVALLFAWAFELTPEGLKRTKDVDRDASVTPQTGKKLEYMIIAGLSLAVVFLVVNPSTIFSVGGDEGASDSDIPSIAVLPFEDFSPEKDQEYFSKGMSEEILNLLAKTESLRVAARTSSFAFYGEDIDIRDVGRKLGVKTILEGSIRKSDDKIRITTQLINVEDGYHIWSETYDRELDDIFAIQDEISGAILSALKVHLLGEDVADNVPTVRNVSIEAYDTFLIGKELMYRETEEDVRAAIQHFNQAIAIDAKYALAQVYKVLAALKLERYTNSAAARDELRTQTDIFAAQAFAMARASAPDLPELIGIEGYYQLRRFQYDAAKESLSRAIHLNPNYAEAYVWRADVHEFQSNFLAMLADREKAYALDPMSIEISRELSSDYRSFGRPLDAKRVIDRMLLLHPNHPDAYTMRFINLTSYGRYGEAALWLEKAVKKLPSERSLQRNLAYIYVYLNMPEKIAELDLVDASNYAPFVAQLNLDMPLAAALVEEKLNTDNGDAWLASAAEIIRSADNKERTRELVLQHIESMDRRGIPWRESCDAHHMERMQYVGLSEAWDTMMAACRARTEERLAVGYLCPCSWYNLVAFAVLDGRKRDAIKYAIEWLNMGDSWATIEVDPFMMALKDEPEHADLLARNAAQVERQRRIYRAGQADDT